MMKRLLIVRSLIGLVVGAILIHIITLLVNYLDSGSWLICMPGLTEAIGLTRALVLQTVLGAVLGMLGLGGMCFFDIEEWSLLRATAAHCMLILVAYMVAGLLLHWFSFHIIPMLIMAGIIIFVYTLIWLIMYIKWKLEIREMNLLAQKYKKDAETGEN
jgi:hypothetical protein